MSKTSSIHTTFRAPTANGRTAAISDHGLIGDTRTAALCAIDGSIDWMCAPAFDSQPIFGTLVGGDRAGSFRVSVTDLVDATRSYVRDSAVIETRLQAATGSGRLVDAMPVEVRGQLLPQTMLVRQLSCDEGELDARVRFDPRLGLPGTPPRAGRRSGGLICEWGSLAVSLQSFPEVGVDVGREVAVKIPAGAQLTLVMTVADRSPVTLVTAASAEAAARETIDWWKEWVRTIDYDGRFRDAVVRSLVTLRLLTYSPSGAPVAAPTTSLPEEIGGVRNWDYRLSWPRDAGLGVAAFLAVGKSDLARSFIRWLLHASRLTRPRLEVLYTLYGKQPRPERELDHVAGYRGSVPVRIGNAASAQHQLDVYGWVLDAAWLLAEAGEELQPEVWRSLSGMADFVADRWREPDAGIWEVRGQERDYVHSKMMAWLCLDRAIKIAEGRRTRTRGLRRWTQERTELQREVLERGFDTARCSYVRSYGSRELDASILLLPVLGLEDNTDRVHGTIDAIRRELGTSGGLVYRYRPGSDGIDGREGAFLPCSFWLVQALAFTGRRDEATQLMKQVLTHANDLGLLSEEVDPSSGEALGNFPQALTHASLIQAALSLARGDA